MMNSITMNKTSGNTTAPGTLNPAAPLSADAPRRREKKPIINTMAGRAVVQAIAVAAFLLIWELGARTGLVSPFLVGSPVQIFNALVRAAQTGALFVDTGYTLFAAILGFVLGTAAGSVLGLALWYSPFVARVIEPFIVSINSVPKIAFAPIVVLWFGTGLVSKVALAVSLTAIIALVAAYEAAKEADPDLQALLLTLGGNKNDVFYKVVVPSTLPYIIATFRINVGFGLVGAVVGEFISSEKGLGHMIFTASSLYDLNSVWAGLFMLMIIGFALYFAIDKIERSLLPWKQQSSGSALRV
jgi:NitT/TauT family transport system permease protein